MPAIEGRRPQPNWRLAVVAIALAILPAAPAAGAPAGEGKGGAGNEKRTGPKPRGIATRSATVPLPPKVQATAIATCPARMMAVGGGFLGTPGGDDPTVATESRRAGPRAWAASGIRADPLTTTPGTITAFVRCRRGGPKLKPVLASATLPAAVQAGVVVADGVTATCPGRRSRALAGGFLAAWDPATTLGPIPQESRRVAKGRGWRFGAAHGNQIAHQITSYAYCARARSSAAAAEVSLAGDLATGSATARGCRRPRLPVAGGYLTSGASLLNGGNLVYVLGSRPAGRTWIGTGLHAGPFTTGTLRSILYCA